MTTPLMAGDRVSFEKTGKDGKIRKLRAVVVDCLVMKTKGEEILVPVQRPYRRSKTFCRLDTGKAPKEPKTRWIPRSKLRKLP